jgi:hypothetical protein
MAHVLFIHGLDNKPEADYLHKLWKRKLAHDDGLDIDSSGGVSSMAYWADVLYESPDTNLAAYESAAGTVEALDDPATPALDLARLPPEDAARLRRLAARLEVDPEAVTEIPPTPAEVEAVRQERVPVPEWLRKRIMARFVRDAHHYFFNLDWSPRKDRTYRVRDEMRKRFLERLRAAASSRPVVVVSHSMGTIVAYDCLMHEPDCPPDDGFPSAKLKGRWVNVYDPLDVIAGFDPHLSGDFKRAGQPAVDDIREDNWGTWRHSISKYLQGRLLRSQLADMLGVSWP